MMLNKHSIMREFVSRFLRYFVSLRGRGNRLIYLLHAKYSKLFICLLYRANFVSFSQHSSRIAILSILPKLSSPNKLPSLKSCHPEKNEGEKNLRKRKARMRFEPQVFQRRSFGFDPQSNGGADRAGTYVSSVTRLGAAGYFRRRTIET